MDKIDNMAHLPFSGFWITVYDMQTIRMRLSSDDGSTAKFYLSLWNTSIYDFRLLIQILYVKRPWGLKLLCYNTNSGELEPIDRYAVYTVILLQSRKNCYIRGFKVPG